MCRARNGNGISSGASTGGNTISCGRGLPAAWNVNRRHTGLDCDCVWTYSVVLHTHMCVHTHTHTHTHTHRGQWPCCESSWEPKRASPYHTQTVSQCKHRNVSDSAASDCGLEKSIRSSLMMTQLQYVRIYPYMLPARYSP